MSKGSKQRPTNKQQFDQGWDRIFKKNKLEQELDAIRSMKDSKSECEKQKQAWIKNEYYDLDKK